MSVPTHTPEPWRFREGNIEGNCDREANRILAERVSPEDADRIVACVNACRGINPAAVPELLQCCIDAFETLKYNNEHACFENGSNRAPSALIRALESAIAKAECDIIRKAESH